MSLLLCHYSYALSMGYPVDGTDDDGYDDNEDGGGGGDGSDGGDRAGKKKRLMIVYFFLRRTNRLTLKPRYISYPPAVPDRAGKTQGRETIKTPSNASLTWPSATPEGLTLSAWPRSIITCVVSAPW